MNVPAPVPVQIARNQVIADIVNVVHEEQMVKMLDIVNRHCGNNMVKDVITGKITEGIEYDNILGDIYPIHRETAINLYQFCLDSPDRRNIIAALHARYGAGAGAARYAQIANIANQLN